MRGVWGSCSGNWRDGTPATVWLLSEPLLNHLVDKPNVFLGWSGLRAGLGLSRPDMFLPCRPLPLSYLYLKNWELGRKRYRAHKLNGNTFSQNCFCSCLILSIQRSWDLTFFFFFLITLTLYWWFKMFMWLTHTCVSIEREEENFSEPRFLWAVVALSPSLLTAKAHPCFSSCLPHAVVCHPPSPLFSSWLHGEWSESLIYFPQQWPSGVYSYLSKCLGLTLQGYAAQWPLGW